MSLSGSAAVAIWNDVSPEAAAEFLAWHTHEHMPERAGTQGFLRARRCRRLQGRGPEFFTLYEVEDEKVLTGEAYIRRLNNPTAWTRRMLPHFRNAARSTCRVRMSAGSGVAGVMATAELPDGVGKAEHEWERVAADLMSASPEVTGICLLSDDSRASGLEIAETNLRTEKLRIPQSVVLLQACAAEAALSGIALLSRRIFGEEKLLEWNLYRTEIVLTARPQQR